MKKILAAFAFLFLLSACAENPPPPVKQETDASPKINLDVLSVIVVDHSVQSANSPYNTNDFRPTIANALRQWATDKFIAVGSTGEAVITIRDASLKSGSLSHSDSMFTREQASKYTGRAEIAVQIDSRDRHGQAVAEATQYVTLPEDPSVRERQNAYTKILNALTNDISAKLRGSMQEHLSNFIITAPIL